MWAWKFVFVYTRVSPRLYNNNGDNNIISLILHCTEMIKREHCYLDNSKCLQGTHIQRTKALLSREE